MDLIIIYFSFILQFGNPELMLSSTVYFLFLLAILSVLDGCQSSGRLERGEREWYGRHKRSLAGAELRTLRYVVMLLSVMVLVEDQRYQGAPFSHIFITLF